MTKCIGWCGDYILVTPDNEEKIKEVLDRWEKYIEDNNIDTIYASWDDPIYSKIMEELGATNPNKFKW